MPDYCINTNQQSNGQHEVHNIDTCTRLPLREHRLRLGSHNNCHEAVKVAKNTYNNINIDGCAYCCPDCNHG